MKLLKRPIVCLLILTLSITGFPMGLQSSAVLVKEVNAGTNDNISYPHFLKADGSVLKNNYGTGDVVYLRGVNAGGYMLQEMWMCPTTITDNVNCQMDILNKLTERFGSEKAKALIDTYEQNYWTETDFDNCADLGINCIRLPIWYRNLVDENDNWYADAFERIDWFVEEAGRHGMYVIIDMHGAQGSQSGSDHSGVDGGDDKMSASQFFFGDNAASNQEKYYKMWEKIAAHFKGNPVVAGYDLLNEPYSSYRYSTGYTDDYLRQLLWGIYDNAYDRIRAIDEDHVIIMEATWWPDDLPDPAVYGWENVMYEYHNYEYSDYDNANGTQISSMQSKIENIQGHSSYNVPSFMGEFNYMSNNETWDEGLQLLNDNGLNWTVWSYKCTSNYGNWGLYNHLSTIEEVNIETDSYETILSKWSKVGESTENTGISTYFKKYTPGTIDGDLMEMDLASTSIPGVSADGGMESMDITITPIAGMPANTQYYVYLDGSDTPVQIISPKIEAEKWSDQSGVVLDSNSTDSDGAALQNVGGTHNGDWTKYSDIDFGEGTAVEITARYAIEYGSVGSNPKLEVYVDSMDSSNLVGTLNLEKITGETWKSYKLGSAVLDKQITGQHDIYIKYVVEGSQNVCNLDWFQFSDQNINPISINVTDLTPGQHSVTVRACVDGNLSEPVTVSDVKVYEVEEGILVSTAVAVEGFQIRTNDRESSVAFRTVCKAPNVGSTITVGNEDYTVVDMGTIYTIDLDASGYLENSIFDKSYTLLNTVEVSDKDYRYVGEKTYNEQNYTFGYIATEKGIFSGWNITDTENTYYVRTIQGMDNVMEHTLHVRAFVVAEDSSGSRVIIYGAAVADMSIPEVADYLYDNSLASNYQGHKYLYSNILNKITQSNPYYRNETVDYGWNDNLFTPSDPTATYPTEFESAK